MMARPRLIVHNVVIGILLLKKTPQVAFFKFEQCCFFIYKTTSIVILHHIHKYKQAHERKNVST